jgi:hypothetical protein
MASYNYSRRAKALSPYTNWPLRSKEFHSDGGCQQTELEPKWSSFMKKALIATAFLLAGSMAHAQSQPAGEGHEHHRSPEIAAACAGKTVGTPVTVTFKSGKTRTIECGVHHHHHHHEGAPGAASGDTPE